MIVVVNARKWFGDQRLGAFHVTLDGKKAGVAFPLDFLEMECATGQHTVRVRQWWYRSEPVVVETTAGQELRLVADVPRDRNLTVVMARMLFRPSRSLSLRRPGVMPTLTATPDLRTRPNRGRDRVDRSKRTHSSEMVIAGLAAFVGFVALPVTLHGGYRSVVAAIVAGLALVVSATTAWVAVHRFRKER
jgi:hypothetical protein